MSQCDDPAVARSEQDNRWPRRGIVRRNLYKVGEKSYKISRIRHADLIFCSRNKDQKAKIKMQRSKTEEAIPARRDSAISIFDM